MKIAFLIASQSAGGAERVASLLCNAWSEVGHTVDILTFQHAETPVHFPLNPDVRHHPLDLVQESRSLPEFVRNNLHRLLTLRRHLQQHRPDVLVSFITEANIIAILAAKSLRIPVVVSERTHPEFHQIGRLRGWFRSRTYRWADRLVVQTENVAIWAKKHLKIEAAVIANPVRLNDFGKSVGGEIGKDNRARKLLIAIGRLSPEKGYDLLLDSFGRLAALYPAWDLTVFGEGPGREALERQIQALGLTSRIFLPGTTQDVAGTLTAADLYVHPSRYEGYPNALVEALATGLCCVATDCPGASRELLRGGEFGLLVKVDCVDDLAAKLETAIGDAELRRRYAAKAPAAVRHIDIATISAVWLDLLKDATQPAQSGR